MKNLLKIITSVGLMVLPSLAFAQTAEPEVGIIGWFQNVEGLILYLVQFGMICGFAFGVWLVYLGFSSMKGNMDGDKQNNPASKILGNIVVGVLFMGGVGTLEGFTGTVFGENTDIGAQEEIRERTRGNGL